MEEKELDLGDYEVTWTLSGRDALRAEIRVTDTGVMCLSVTAGACYSATPPGVTISAFTVTGHLKPSAPPPPEVAKFRLSEVVENHLPEWISGYACASCTGTYVYHCPAGYNRTECVVQTKLGVHGCCSSCVVAFVKCEREPITPPVGMCNQSFRVIDSETGNPIAGATISLTGGKGPLTTNSFGRCSVQLETGKSYGWSVLKGGYKTGYPPLFTACTTEKSIQLVSLTPPVTPPVTPPTTISSWIDETGVHNLKRDHWLYAYDLYIGAESAAEALYTGLYPKPSRIPSSLVTRDNWLALYNYSIGAISAGNALSGGNY